MTISHSRPTLNNDSLKAVQSCIRSEMIAKGSLNTSLERRLSDYLEQKYVLTTSSGTMAWLKILLALGVTPGDEVLLPDYICSSLISPILAIKATPILYDNAHESWSTSDNEIISKITSKTKVILFNHVFGIRCSVISSLRQKVRDTIYFVEDCCHAFTRNSMISNAKISVSSTCSFYSFNATKLIAAGEGGAIATNDDAFFDELESFNIGDNLSDLSCSLVLSQLASYDKFLKQREAVALFFLEKFPEQLTQKLKTLDSIWFRFPIWTGLQHQFFRNTEISYRKGVDTLLTFLLKTEPLPNALDALNHTVSVPIYPSLTQKEQLFIVRETRRIYDHN